MHTKILAKNGSGNFKELATSSTPLSAGSYEISMGMPKDSGKGVIKKIKLQCGIILAILDYKTFMPFISTNKDEAPVFGFSFSLSGKTKMNLRCHGTPLNIREGQSNCFYYPEKTGVCEDCPEDHIIRVSLQIEPDLFHDLMEKELQVMPVGLSRPAEKGSGEYFNAVDMITPSMHAVLDQIIHCPYSGTVRQLFLEGKVLELMAYKLEQLAAKKVKRDDCIFIKPDDVDRVREAENLLIINFQNPPGLSELSHQVGMSRTKLLNTFKNVYNTTPAGYIRKRRLEKAKLLLENGKMNVSETAYFVGYSSLSHFSMVFRQYYGTLPSRHYHKRRLQPTR